MTERGQWILKYLNLIPLCSVGIWSQSRSLLTVSIVRTLIIAPVLDFLVELLQTKSKGTIT